MSLIVYTARLPSRHFAGYTGPDRLDITRGAGREATSPFAPSRKLDNEINLRKRKTGDDEAQLQAAWAWYEPQYLAEMRESYRRHRAAWEGLLRRGEVTLCCYCGTAHRCHRRTLAGILVKLGAVDRGERLAAGEVAAVAKGDEQDRWMA